MWCGVPAEADRAGLQVALQPGGVGRLAVGARVAQRDLVGVALEPGSGGVLAQLQSGLGEPAAQSQSQVVAQVQCRSVSGRQRLARRDPVDERPHGPLLLLGDREGMHPHHHHPAGAGPEAVGRVGAGRAGDQVAARAPVGVHGPLHRGEHVGGHLPLVEQHGLVPAAQRGVGAGMERGRIVGVEPHDSAGQTGRGGGLAAGAGSDDHHRGQLREILLQQRVDQPRQVTVHAESLDPQVKKFRFCTVFVPAFTRLARSLSLG